MHIPSFRVPFIALLAVSGAIFAQELAFHVATNGSDQNPGTAAKPFATLTKARDSVRESRKAGARGAVTVTVHGGSYFLKQGFVLEEQDSGTAEAPVIYTAASGEEVRLVGGRQLAAGLFRPVTDAGVLARLPEEARRQVRVVDLAQAGVTNLSELPTKFRGAAKYAEVFFNDVPLELARWPNEGWATIKSVIDRGGKHSSITGPDGKPGNGTFEYAEERPARWNIEKGVWLHGYWCHDWYDEAIRVAAIDTAKKHITFAAAHGYGIGPSHKWNKAPRRYRAMNVLEELDTPGEWYIDVKMKRLYLWPPEDPGGARVVVSVLSDPIVALRSAAHVTLRGVVLECTRGDAVVVSGGHDNRLSGCTVRNTGGSAVAVSGERNSVVGCDIYQTGTSGIKLSGGSRNTLIPARNIARNNHIHHFARLQRTYAAAIHLSGVGNIASHNLIHDCPHSGILYGGNEHLIEYNEIFRTSQETGDVGALYTGRDWGTQGNVIKHNFIHHTGGVKGWSMGVYLDDCDSGDTIVGNIFYRVTRAAFIGGGRNNMVENNVFVDCSPAVHVDDRGKSRIKWGAGLKESWDLEAKLRRYRFQQPPWSDRYPHLVNILDDQPELPLHNVIRRNVAVGGKWLNARGKIKSYLTMEDNLVTDADPGFVSPETMDFRFRKDSRVWQEVPGFEAIPLEAIGLYQDSQRASWPVDKPICEGGLAPPEAKIVKASKKLPVFKVTATPASLDVDGDIRAEEWRDADKAGSMLIAQDIGGGPAKPVSRAWLMASNTGLLVAVENEIETGKTLVVGDTWGSCDAVEIALRMPGSPDDKTLIYRGFTTGLWQCSDEAGMSAADRKRAAEGVQYAVEVAADGKWTTEWVLPWNALGLSDHKGKQLLFNITVRKPATGLWLMWQGTGGYSYRVENAGRIQLP